MSALIYNFKMAEVPKISEVGGKAKALIETTRAGFYVPEGFVLTVDFFKPWLDEIKSLEEWQLLLNEVTLEKCNILKNLATKKRFTDSQKTAFHEFISQLQSSDKYAVRSSSPEEDLMGTSFAGMYDSILGVTNGSLEEAIAKTFSSTFDFRVLEYKNQNNINLENTCISVIVQKQIDSDISGIAFSLNPQNNSYDEVVINASFGLGETIVGGLVTPDIYVVDKVKNRIIEKKINEKTHGLWLKADGGTENRDNISPRVQALSDKEIFEVTSLIKKCEEYYDFPIDIEWAYEKGTLYLLQARPITTYIPLLPEMITKPGEKKILYSDLIGTSQGFTEPLSVLGLDIWTKVMDTVGGQGMLPEGKDGFLLNSGGKQYYIVPNMIKGLGTKTAMAILGRMDYVLKEHQAEIVSEYTTDKITAKMKTARKVTFKTGFGYIPIVIKMLINPIKEKNIYNENINNFIKSIKNIKNDEIFDKVIDASFEPLKPIMENAVAYLPGQIAINSIKRMFKGMNLDKYIQGIGMDLSSNPTALMGRSLYELACHPEFVETMDEDIFQSKIANKSYSKSFMDKCERHLYLYGDRGFKEIDISTERVKNNLNELFNQVKLINIDNNQLKNAGIKKNEAYKQLRNEAAKIGKSKKFEKNAKIYEHLFGFRETPKYLVVMLTGVLHDIAIEIGEQFVREGRLNISKQIFDLHIIEIVEAQENKQMNLFKLIEANMISYEKNKHIKKWPTNIDSRGKIFAPIPKGKDGDLVGEAISSGIIRGKAKVLETPYEKKLLPGEILVTHATEPAWTPIFINASGVVLEVGGMLQHGAIIAREYGIPCVSGLRDATSVIKDGDLLEVDGTSGIVRILNDSSNK